MDTIETDEIETGLVEDADETPETGVYEIGYHLLPTISEDELPGVVSTIVDFLKAEGAVFVGERSPSTMSLAYPIAKRISGKRVNFESAYFGWVAFELGRASIEKVKTFMDSNQSVLRYLIVRTDRDSVHAAMSGAVAHVQQPAGDIGKPKRDAEAGGEMSEAALDEALKTMETEDSKAVES